MHTTVLKYGMPTEGVPTIALNSSPCVEESQLKVFVPTLSAACFYVLLCTIVSFQKYFVCVLCVCGTCVQVPAEAKRSSDPPGAGMTHGCELPHLGAGN